MNFKDTILLTGAGFTANFGGFLAKEMWSKIFNNPQLNSAGNVKRELKKSFDFENIYSRIFDSRSGFQQGEIQIFEDAVNQAYISMDEVIKQPSWSQSYGVHEADLRKFLDFFRNEQDGKFGACFTLNQDLFLERNFSWQPLGPTSMRFSGSFGNIDPRDINSTSLKSLPTTEELEQFKRQFSGEFSYIKLHGSSRWIAQDGKNTKVIGVNKLEVINNIPLLKWYFELFQQALYQGDMHLVVIGYSFKDPHINLCIKKGITEYGLKLYVISPEDPDKFYFRMTHKYPSGTAINDQNMEGIPIWEAIDGYFPYKMKDIFPYPQRASAEKIEIFKSIGIPLVN